MIELPGVPGLTTSDVHIQAKTAVTYVARGGSLSFWLQSKAFTRRQRDAILAEVARLSRPAESVSS